MWPQFIHSWSEVGMAPQKFPARFLNPPFQISKSATALIIDQLLTFFPVTVYLFKTATWISTTEIIISDFTLPNATGFFLYAVYK